MEKHPYMLVDVQNIYDGFKILPNRYDDPIEFTTLEAENGNKNFERDPVYSEFRYIRTEIVEALQTGDILKIIKVIGDIAIEDFMS